MNLSSKTGRRLGAAIAAILSAQISATAAVAAEQVLEEIVVTAQKREQNLSETPLSITALTGSALEAMAATQFRDFATTVPGLNYTTAGIGATQVNLRGVTTGTDISPTVGIYVDEVPYGSSTPFASASQLALDVGLYDVQRVEILRGPQGTLYGASTMGGLLKYVTTPPDTTAFGGLSRAGVSSTDEGGTSFDVSSVVNVPLAADKAALRLSGFYAEDGGYIDNVQLGKDDVNQADVYGGRGDLLWNANDRLSVRLAVYAQDIKRDGNATADYDLATAKPVAGDLDQFVILPEPFEQEFRLASATVGYQFDSAELTSITSYQTSDVHQFLDASDLYVPLLNFVFANSNPPIPIVLGAMGIQYRYETDKFVQELRLADTGEKLDWLVGAFYTKEDSQNTQHVPGYDPDGALVPVNFGVVEVPSTFEEIAGFATLTYHATSKVDLEGGLRYSHNSQEQEQIGSGVLIGSAPKRDSSESPVTYLANVRYQASDNLMTYVRVASGYRPGGPNLVINDPRTGQPLAPPTFDSDSLTSYEAGIKASTQDRRYSVDAAIYTIDWNDLQINVARNGVGVVGNAGSARSTGTELTLTGRPLDALTLVGAFAYINAELTEDSPNTDPLNGELGGERGDPLPNTPEFTAALSADYAFNIAGRDASAGATWRFIDDRVDGYKDGSNPQYDLPSYDTLDLRSRIEFGSTYVQLYVKNVFDERGLLSAGTALTALGGPVTVSTLQPRTYGISINVDF
jgi:iron complex outermembrane receptor protein